MPIPENGELRGIAMWNNIFLFCLIFGLTCSLAAQNYRAGRRSRSRRGTQNVSVQVPTAEKQEKPAAATKNNAAAKARKQPAGKKYDPSKPKLTEEAVKKILDENIRKKVLERKIPKRLKDCKTEEFFSQSECSNMLSEYKNLTDNFELTEVTWVKPDWYKRYGAELEKFKPIAFEMYVAMRKLSDPLFESAIAKFQKQQEACLKFLKEKPPRITKEEYQALLLKNTRIRRQNYLKMLQEKREAAMKRQQEQLKQLRQKSQQKNRGQTTATSAEKKKE